MSPDDVNDLMREGEADRATVEEARAIAKAASLALGAEQVTREERRAVIQTLTWRMPVLAALAIQCPGEWDQLLLGWENAGPGMPPVVASLRRSGKLAVKMAAKSERTVKHREQVAGRPEIVISTDMEPVVDAAVRALHEKGGIYKRGPFIVRVARDVSADEMDAKRWDPDAPALRIVKPAGLRVAMSSAAAWVKVSETTEGIKYSPSLPPDWAVDAIMAHTELPFRRANGISEIPILRPDGRLHQVPGYDPVTGVIYEPPPGFVLQTSTCPLDQRRASECYRRLCEPFADFPFSEPCHLSAAVSCLLSMVARHAIEGPVPLFPFLSTTPKSGKSLMVETIHLLAMGREVARMQPGSTEEEIEKRITSIAMSGAPVVLFDNLTGTFGGASIDAAVQARSWSSRALGGNEMVDLPIRTIWTVTGNNLGIKGDLAQRVIPIQLAPADENPELRTDFRIWDLRAYVRDPEMRGEILLAAFDLLRAHALAGRPSVGTFGGYVEWHQVIRSALIWAGAPDPFAGVATLAEDADERKGHMQALLSTWYAAFVAEPVYLADLPKLYASDSSDTAPMFGVIKTMAPGKDGNPDFTRFAYLLRSSAGRNYAGFRLQRSDVKKHGARGWTVQKVS
jgi:hypothetical protein